MQDFFNWFENTESYFSFNFTHQNIPHPVYYCPDSVGPGPDGPDRRQKYAAEEVIEVSDDTKDLEEHSASIFGVQPSLTFITPGLNLNSLL
jgi:hypothetical protein